MQVGVTQVEIPQAPDGKPKPFRVLEVESVEGLGVRVMFNLEEAEQVGKALCGDVHESAVEVPGIVVPGGGGEKL